MIHKRHTLAPSIKITNAPKRSTPGFLVAKVSVAATDHRREAAPERVVERDLTVGRVSRRVSRPITGRIAKVRRLRRRRRDRPRRGRKHRRSPQLPRHHDVQHRRQRGGDARTGDERPLRPRHERRRARTPSRVGHVRRVARREPSRIGSEFAGPHFAPVDDVRRGPALGARVAPRPDAALVACTRAVVGGNARVVTEVRRGVLAVRARDPLGTRQAHERRAMVRDGVRVVKVVAEHRHGDDRVDGDVEIGRVENAGVARENPAASSRVCDGL
mmetsp:Transcript_155/g.587  ORF Transcript_155/g.587 Transcript_155/m.587 type:complete len:273 (+) Transcript_155:1680-2498(+)